MNTYPDRAVRGNDAVDGRLGKRVKVAIGPAHKVRLQEEAAVTVVLELAHVQLHAQVGRLEVKRDHLAAGVPKYLLSQG